MTRQQAGDAEREALLAKVHNRLGASPLCEVAEALKHTITDPRVPVPHLKAFVQRILDDLPGSFGRRFAFDAAMIQDIAQAWSTGVLRLSQMIVPVFGKPWAYSRQPMHPESLPTHFVELIHLPGGDVLDDVNLLSYPWLCHELGHLVLSRPQSAFADEFGAHLRSTLAQMDPVPDGEFGPPDEAALNEVEKCWAPTPNPGARATPNPEDWANECAADVIALWTCGPAFIAAMENTVANGVVDPYSIKAPHPPYEVRLRAVVPAARFLGWEQRLPHLEAIARKWEEDRQHQLLAPNYAHLTHPRLIERAVLDAIDACLALELPPCTPAVVSQVREAISTNHQPHFGVKLLLSARLLRELKGPDAYQAWETNTVTTLAEGVML